MAGAVLHMQWEGVTGVQGAAEPSHTTVTCRVLRSLLVRHYLAPSYLGCLDKPSALTGPSLLATEAGRLNPLKHLRPLSVKASQLHLATDVRNRLFNLFARDSEYHNQD